MRAVAADRRVVRAVAVVDAVLGVERDLVVLEQGVRGEGEEDPVARGALRAVVDVAVPDRDAVGDPDVDAVVRRAGHLQPVHDPIGDLGSGAVLDLDEARVAVLRSRGHDDHARARVVLEGLGQGGGARVADAASGIRAGPDQDRVPGGDRFPRRAAGSTREWRTTRWTRRSRWKRRSTWPRMHAPRGTARRRRRGSRDEVASWLSFPDGSVARGDRSGCGHVQHSAPLAEVVKPDPGWTVRVGSRRPLLPSRSSSWRARGRSRRRGSARRGR